MKSYTRITCWENKRRVKKLCQFRGFLLKYYNNSHRGCWTAEPSEEDAAQEARVLINKALNEVNDIILQSKNVSILQYSPPPAVGGRIQNVDLLYDIFNLHKFDIPPSYVFDLVDRSIGVYESNYTSALIRTFNPFYYIGMVLDYVASIPFVFIGKFGLNREQAETSILGRLSKLFLYILTAAASTLTILYYLNWL